MSKMHVAIVAVQGRARMMCRALLQVILVAHAGVGMLAKLLGNGTKSSAIPRPEVQGPDQIDNSTWAMTYSFRTGVMKYSIKAEFSFDNGKIVLLHNRRV